MATPLLDWIIDLMRDEDAREAFNSNPQTTMATAGFTNACGSDVRPALLGDVRQVGGVDFPQVAGANNPQQIQYVTNNYTIASPSSSVAPADDNPNINVPGDGSTVTTTDEHSPTDNSDDNSTENDSKADNIVSGQDAAGEDQIRDSQITDVGQGITGDNNSSFLTLVDVVNIGDVHVLSDLIDDTMDETLNFSDSPVGQDVLNESLNDSLNNLINHLI